MLLCVGCWNDVPYQPPSASAPDSEEVSHEEATSPESEGEAASPEPLPEILTETPPLFDDHRASPVAAEQELFPEPDPSSVAQATPAETSDAPVATGGAWVAPWETEAEVATTPSNNEAASESEARPEASTPVPESTTAEVSTPSDMRLPWEVDEPAPPPGPAPEPEPIPDAPTPAPELEKPPAPAKQPDSRYVAWLLGAKLSYAMLAPSEQAEAVAAELPGLAQQVGLSAPEIDLKKIASEKSRVRELLRLGQQTGTELSATYGADHAALVEVALKSNLLLTLYPQSPHLAHSINGSVSAAAVRAGLPEEIWNPWQEAVAKAESVDQVQEAVIRLHTEIDHLLNSPKEDSGESLIR